MQIHAYVVSAVVPMFDHVAVAIFVGHGAVKNTFHLPVCQAYQP